MNIEIEIKVGVGDFGEIKKILRSKNVKSIKKVHQIDEYYSPVHRDFYKSQHPTEWLRIRNNQKSARFEYDISGDDKEKIPAKEYEIEISNAETMRKILKFLNFKKCFIIDKVREYWRLGDFEICLDKVKGLGNF